MNKKVMRLLAEWPNRVCESGITVARDEDLIAIFSRTYGVGENPTPTVVIKLTHDGVAISRDFLAWRAKKAAKRVLPADVSLREIVALWEGKDA